MSQIHLDGEPVTGHSGVSAGTMPEPTSPTSTRGRSSIQGISMSIDEGWIKLHRKIRSSICWTYSATVRLVWIEILLKANHGKAFWKGVEIQSGQFCTSLDHLSRDSKATISQVRTAIRLLSEWGQVKVENVANRMTRITVCNWSSYQESSQTKSQTDDKPMTNQSQTDSNKQECKNEEKEKNEENTPLPPKGDGDFESVWAAYPSKTGKENALKAWVKWAKAGDTKEAALAGIARYVAHVEASRKNGFADLKFQNGSTFFHGRGWISEWVVPEIRKRRESFI